MLWGDNMDMSQTKPLEEIIRELPQQALDELKDFANYLLESRKTKRYQESANSSDFVEFVGVANNGATNLNPRFKSEDEIWEE